MPRHSVRCAIVALALATGGAAGGVDSPLVRLRELFHSIRTTHGGPAYVSDADLTQLHQRADRLLAERGGDGCSEEAYAETCQWLMDQLVDPLASHLRPTQAIAARERFHGVASLGMDLRVCTVPSVAEDDDGDDGTAAGGDGLGGAAAAFGGAGWWRRWCARRAAVVTAIEAGSPAARAASARAMS